MTEEEAKTKWCPHARVDSTASNRPDSYPGHDIGSGKWPTCIGSACMAWRWVASIPTFQKVDPLNPLSTYSKTRAYSAPAPTHGFCGLAGQP